MLVTIGKILFMLVCTARNLDSHVRKFTSVHKHLCIFLSACLPSVVRCDRPRDILNGTLTSKIQESYEFNTTISYQCSDGFQMSGGAGNRTCLSSGLFDGEQLTCEGKLPPAARCSVLHVGLKWCQIPSSI